jgi:hypothetical protein
MSTAPGGEPTHDHRAALLSVARAHAGRKVMIEGGVPPKKLANLQAFVPSGAPIVVAIDLTLFGSAKDALVFTDTQLHDATSTAAWS